MKKFKINSAKTDNFDVDTLRAYLRQEAEQLMERYETDKTQVHTVAQAVPGYNPDWCRTEVTQHDLDNKKRLIDLMVNYATDMLLGESKEYESQ